MQQITVGRPVHMTAGKYLRRPLFGHIDYPMTVLVFAARHTPCIKTLHITGPRCAEAQRSVRLVRRKNGLRRWISA